MRTLILGTAKKINTKLGIYLTLQDVPVKWSVVSSCKSSLSLWRKVVLQVCATQDFQVSDLSSDNEKSLVVDQVLAATFFDKKEVKNRLEFDSDLMVITSSPRQYLEQHVLQKFDQVYLTRTTSVEKLAQYHTIYVDVRKLSFERFKMMCKNLADDQVMQIDEQGEVKVIEFTNFQNIEMKEKKQQQQQQQQVSEQKQQTISTPPDTTVDLKMQFQQVDANALHMVLEQLANPLLKGMIDKTYQQEQGNLVTFTFSVYSARYDLFLPLMGNLLRSLSASELITKGVLIIVV